MRRSLMFRCAFKRLGIFLCVAFICVGVIKETGEIQRNELRNENLTGISMYADETKGKHMQCIGQGDS